MAFHALPRFDFAVPLIALAVVGGCSQDGGGQASTSEGATTGTSVDETTGSSSTTDASDTDSSDTDNMAGVYAECMALPEADLAQWEIGPDIVPTAESTPERLASMGDFTWELALRLLDVTPEPGSVAMSPTSMSIALGMSYRRWQGEQCGGAILSAVPFPESENELHETLGAGIRELESRVLPESEEGGAVVVGLRSSLWSIGTEELSDALEWYGGRHHLVSDDNLGAVREVMNCVIESDSHGLLTDFVPEGQPAEDTSAYEVNVAVLQAPWATALQGTGLTFTRDDGTTEQVDGVGHGSLTASHYENESFAMLDVPLRGHALSVMIVMPAEGIADLATLESSLTAHDLMQARDMAVSTFVEFAMPKVVISGKTIDYDTPLGIDCEPFKLRSVLHGVAVDIDEKGIKAAAATVNETFVTGGEEPEPEVTFVVDRPFLFFAYDRETGFVLYNGRFTGA